MKVRLALALAVVGAGAAIALYVQSASSMVDDREAGEYGGALREVSSLSVRRTSALLLSRSGLVRHYDELAAVELQLRQAHASLRDTPRFISDGERRRLLAALQKSERVHADGELLVESFKRELAILRNSTGFLTALAREVAHFQPSTAEGVALARSLDSFLRDLLALQMAHDQEATDVARSALVKLRAEDPRAAEWTSADLPLVLRHGEIAVEKTGVVDRLLRQILALPSAASIEQTRVIYLAAYHAALDRRSQARALIVLFLFVGGAASASYVILRLRRAALQLAESGAELRVAVDSLREERNKQAELAELKSRFVATTSHEFRTPLSVIMSSAEMLAAYGEVWPADKAERHLGRIRNSAANMTRMLEDVLLLGQAESGRLEFSPGPLDLRTFCDELVASAELADGSSRRVHLQFEGPDEPVVADEALLRHALGNLLSNALKYSAREEAVTFSVHSEADQLRFSIQDRGIGISAEDQKHLFSSFHRGANVGRIKGSGLGLSIVKHAIDLQHGTIDLKSELGQGTRVVVCVPLDLDAGAAA